MKSSVEKVVSNIEGNQAIIWVVLDCCNVSLHTSPVAHQASSYPSFYSPLDGMLVHGRVTPSIRFASNHSYTWVKRGTVRVECPAQEHKCP